jgi:hypothetical protein
VVKAVAEAAVKVVVTATEAHTIEILVSTSNIMTTGKNYYYQRNGAKRSKYDDSEGARTQVE